MHTRHLDRRTVRVIPIYPQKNLVCVQGFNKQTKPLHDNEARHKICSNNRCVRIYQSHLSPIAYFLGSG